MCGSPLTPSVKAIGGSRGWVNEPARIDADAAMSVLELVLATTVIGDIPTHFQNALRAAILIDNRATEETHSYRRPIAFEIPPRRLVNGARASNDRSTATTVLSTSSGKTMSVNFTDANSCSE